MAKGDYSAASYDVIMQQNDAFSEQFILKDSAGDLLALAGYSFESQVIVGDPACAASRLGGVWLPSDTKVGVGWLVVDGQIVPPAAPEPDVFAADLL